MADAFELLGVAAVFIDESGFALHINDSARRRLGPQLWIDDGRLRAADLDLDEALSAAIESALINRAPAHAAADLSFASESRGAVSLKVLPVVAEAHDPFQLLKAVVDHRRAGRRGLAAGSRASGRPELKRRARKRPRRGAVFAFFPPFLSDKRVDACGGREYGPRTFDRQ